MSDSASRDANVKHRNEQIAKALRQYETLDEEKKAAAEAQTELLKTLKYDTGITPKAFKNAYKLLQTPQDDADTMLDEMREVMEVGGRGTQLDWVAISERREKARADAFADEVVDGEGADVATGGTDAAPAA